jgi:Lrp/AsnC family leucine-responsive transcriptional regulator
MNSFISESGFDGIDHAILDTLQANGRVSNADLARQIYLSPPAVHNRIKRLERAGIIEQYVALVNRESLGYGLLCFVYLTMERHDAEHWNRFREAIAEQSQIIECYQQTGDFDVVMKIIATSRDDLNQLISQKISTIPGVCRVKTNVVIDEIKATTALPLK